MAIPLTSKSFMEAVGVALDDVFLEHPGWAVSFTYDYNSRTYTITAVELWDLFKHGAKHKPIMPYTIYIREGRDEIDAYMQAKKQLEQAE